MGIGIGGEKRPVDVIDAAVMVGRITTVEIAKIQRAASWKVHSGVAGAEAPTGRLSKKDRSIVTLRAAAIRWI